MLRGYVAMVYMRSQHLEDGLEMVVEGSSLFPFKQYLGRCREGTIAQHIRNAFSHGTFQLSDDLQSVTFIDRNWNATVLTSNFIDDFCGQVFRLYGAALETGRGVA